MRVMSTAAKATAGRWHNPKTIIRDKSILVRVDSDDLASFALEDKDCVMNSRFFFLIKSYKERIKVCNRLQN